MPRGKKHTAEQIIGKLRGAELAISKGRTAEVAVTRKLFATFLDRIERLTLPPPVVARCSE